MARTLDKPAQDTLRGRAEAPLRQERAGAPGSESATDESTRCMYLLGVEGHKGQLNDVIFKPALRRPVEVPARQRTLVFFGGDVQNFSHLMDQNNANTPVNEWCLESTACRLGAGYPYHHIVVIKPSRIVFDDISCFDNFVPGNQLGAPQHTYHYHGVPHLEKLLRTISHKIRRMQVEELCGMLFKMEEENDGPVNVDQEDESSDSTAQRNLITAREMAMYCWWQKHLKLHKYQLTVVGFSKGCVVLNQFLYEFHYARHLAPDNQDSSIINRIEAMYWLDGGHPGHSNTWLTARALLHTLTKLGICVHVHVSKYQVEDQSRPWIGREEKEFVATLRALGAKVFRHLHASETTDLSAHFNVLAKFMEVEKTFRRRLPAPDAAPHSDAGGPSQGPSDHNPSHPAPDSSRGDSGPSGSADRGPFDDHDTAPILIHSIGHQVRDSPNVPPSGPSDASSATPLTSTDSSNRTANTSSTSETDPLSALFPLNLDDTLQVSVVQPLLEQHLALYVSLTRDAPSPPPAHPQPENKKKVTPDTEQLRKQSSKLQTEILTTSIPYPAENPEINMVVPKRLVVPRRRRTDNPYSDVIISPVVALYEEESSQVHFYSPVGSELNVRYNHSLYTPGVRPSNGSSTSSSPVPSPAATDSDAASSDNDSSVSHTSSGSNASASASNVSSVVSTASATGVSSVPLGPASSDSSTSVSTGSSGPDSPRPTVPVSTSPAAPVSTSRPVPVSTSRSAPVSTSRFAPGTTRPAPVSTSRSTSVFTSRSAPLSTSRFAPGATSRFTPGATSRPAPVSTSRPRPAPVSTSRPTPVSISRPRPAPVSTSRPAPVSNSRPAPVSTSRSASVSTSRSSSVSTSRSARVSTSRSARVSTSRSARVSTSRSTPVPSGTLAPISAAHSVSVSTATSDSVSTSPAALLSMASTAPVSTAPLAITSVSQAAPYSATPPVSLPTASIAPIMRNPPASVSTVLLPSLPTASTTSITTDPSSVSTGLSDPPSMASTALVAAGPSVSVHLSTAALTATAAPRMPQIRRPRRNSCPGAPSPFVTTAHANCGRSMPSDIDYYATPNDSLNEDPFLPPSPGAGGSGRSIAANFFIQYHLPQGGNSVYDGFGYADVNRQPVDLVGSDSDG